ncbi:MAG: transcriptional repressor [Chloroflexi bacterium]|nr:transcriptional repressor [Chloroflexota bacterium]
MLNSLEILARLERTGHRATWPRRVVVEAVAEQPNRFTAGELCAAVERRPAPVGRATVFRTLELLERLGVLERVHSAGGRDSYIVGEQAQHHHHLVCSSCGTVADVEGCTLTTFIRRLASEYGFQVDGHMVEVFGRCRACAS